MKETHILLCPEAWTPPDVHKSNHKLSEEWPGGPLSCVSCVGGSPSPQPGSAPLGAKVRTGSLQPEGEGLEGKEKGFLVKGSEIESGPHPATPDS